MSTVVRSLHHTRVHADPTFGYDGWKNPDRSPAEVEAEHVASVAAANVFGADTIGGDLHLMPAGLAVYMSYVDNFGGWGELAALIHSGKLGKDAFGVSIAVNSPRHVARMGDFEPGGLTNGDLGIFQTVSGPHFPGLELIGYTNAANLHLFDGHRMIRESAHFGQGMHVCGPHTCGFPQADLTQWDDKGPHGENYDRIVIPAATLERIRGKQPTPPADQQANAALGVDLHTGHWTIRGTAGNFRPSASSRVMRASVTFDTHTGHWTIAGDPVQG